MSNYNYYMPKFWPTTKTFLASLLQFIKSYGSPGSEKNLRSLRSILTALEYYLSMYSKYWDLYCNSSLSTQFLAEVLSKYTNSSFTFLTIK